ncbi:hypothetical protein ATK36_2957 [Amycolatopsis sulphurea]|uniref:Uncharacterized protein n=1 Tax=Amycolatopsis sulphurea TaxID=76022 RepID=A0A2A9FAR9_9PSEU|nr:hypothetical protein ATK36_2957 [Amycolatopsis sulphurea]
MLFEQILATDRGPAVPQLTPTLILDRTQIHGLLATGHPYLDEAFDAIVNNGTVAIQLVTLIPLTGTEVRQAQTSGLDTLEATDPALLDVTRAD